MFTIISRKLYQISSQKLLLYGFFIYYGLTFFSVIIISITDWAITDFLYLNSIKKTKLTSANLIQEIGVMKGVFIVSIWGPIVEESAFRIFISPYKEKVAFGWAILFLFLTGSTDFWEWNTVNVLRLIGSLFLVLTVLKFFNEDYWKVFLINNKSKIVYGTSVFFALAHIGNFDTIQWPVFFLYPIYVLPQFFLGVILAWFRVERGFGWAVLFHILVNGSVTWPKLIAYVFQH